MLLKFQSRVEREAILVKAQAGSKWIRKYVLSRGAPLLYGRNKDREKALQ